MTNNQPTLVFLHYFAGSAREWEAVIGQLTHRFRCIAIDLPGHGESAGSQTGYSVDAMADYVTDACQKANIDTFSLVGHSMGGKVALALAAGTPDCGLPDRRNAVGLQSLVLLSPSPPTPEPIADDDRQQLLQGYGQRVQAEKTVRNITQMPLSEAIREQIITDTLRTTKPAWDAWLTGGSREDISARMSRITVPVRILVGSDDRALPPAVQQQQVLPRLNHATLKTVPGAGHLLPLEVPDTVARFISDSITDI